MSTSRYRVPIRNRFFRKVLRPVFRGLFHFLGKVEMNGVKNIPQEGAYLVCPNHVSIVDGPFVAAFWPRLLEFAGAAEIWEKKGQSLLARLYGGVKVHRGEFDRALIEATLSILGAGYPLLIAPEGGRSHQPGLRPAHPGVAYLADKARVPIVPVGVYGCTEDFISRGFRGDRQVIGMNIGQPFWLPKITGKGSVRRGERQKNADLVMAHIARLLPPEYRGFYANHTLPTLQP